MVVSDHSATKAEVPGSDEPNQDDQSDRVADGVLTGDRPAGGDDGNDGNDGAVAVGVSSARTFVDWVLVIVAALLIAVGVRTFVMAHFRVEGNSMLETLHPGDRVFVNKLSYRFGEPSRGDVVVLHELQGERDLIKRVIALPGETIRIEDCKVYIDDQVLPEPYLSEAVLADESWCSFGPTTVPDGDVFVMGDNRPSSADSRYFGPIPESDIVGHAFVIFWPVSDASGL